MEVQERKFTGVFIPAEIYEMKGITWAEKILWCEIQALSGTGACYASNEYLAEKFETTPGVIANRISKLKKIGLIKQVGFDGRHRFLKVAYGVEQDNVNTNDDVKADFTHKCKQGSQISEGSYNKIKYKKKEDDIKAEPSHQHQQQVLEKAQPVHRLELTDENVCTNPPIPDNKQDNIPDDGNNACAYEQHQQVLKKAQPYTEIFLTDLWITEFVALWNSAAQTRKNWQIADVRYLGNVVRQKIKQRANEFYNKYKPTHPEMSEKTLAEDLIKATIYRYDNSDTYQGLTKGQVAFTIQKIFTNDKDWYKFLNCEWVQR